MTNRARKYINQKKAAARLAKVANTPLFRQSLQLFREAMESRLLGDNASFLKERPEKKVYVRIDGDLVTVKARVALFPILSAKGQQWPNAVLDTILTDEQIKQVQGMMCSISQAEQFYKTFARMPTPKEGALLYRYGMPYVLVQQQVEALIRKAPLNE